MKHRHRNETEKTSKLLDELIQLKENMRLTKIKQEETRKQNEADALEIKALTGVINEKQTVVNKLTQVVDHATRTNEQNELKFNNFQKANAALEAKLMFIEEKYDYSSTAKGLTINDFREIMSSNNQVNTTLKNFNTNLEKIQKDIQTHEVLKEANRQLNR